MVTSLQCTEVLLTNTVWYIPSFRC